MNALIPAFWQAADLWGSSVWRASLVACVALAIAWAIARWCTFLSPRVVCWIWRLACLKLLVALLWIPPIDLAWLPAKPVPAVVEESELPTRLSVEFQGEHTGAGFTFDGIPAANPAENPRPPLSILAGFLLPLWLIGIVCSIYRTVREWRSIGQLRASSQICTADRLLRMLQTEGQRLGVRRLPRLLFSRQVESPLLVGLWRPAIILPEGVEQKFDEAELRLMIAHELAHLKRHDLAWNWLPTLANWLFFFHPLVWVMIRRWSEAAEAACDEMLIQRHVAQPADYGRLLLKLSACSPFESSAALGAAGVLGAYRNLERRILAMARVRPFSARRFSAAAGLLLLAAIVTIVPWRLVAQEPEAISYIYNVPFQTYAFVRQRPREPKADLDPVSARAIDRLKELGARVFEQENGLLVSIQYGWKGTDADLNLLADLAEINQLDLHFDFVGPEAVGKLKLKYPVESLALTNLSDERVAALKHLPPCKHLVLSQQTLSAEGFRRLAQLAEGIESLLPALTGSIDDERLAAIGKIRSLKKLDLQMAEITDAGLAHLAGLDKLEELWLMGCMGIHGAGYANLAPVESLRTLKIYMPVDADGFRALATLTQLTKLELWPDACVSAGQEPAGVDALKSLVNLRSLEVTANRSEQPTIAFCDAVLQVAAQMPELRSLRVLNLDTNAASLAMLTGCPQLEELFLGQIKLNDGALAIFGDLKNLKKLRLMSSGEIDPPIWEKLGQLQPLVSLRANHSGVDDAGLAQLAGLTGLEGLSLAGSKITGIGLKSLTNFKQLKTLTLSDSPLDDEGGALLGNFPAIEFLDLSKTKITDRTLDAIGALPDLRTLTLDETQVTAEGLMKLRKLQQLSRISVKGIKLSIDEMKRLRAALREVVIEGAPTPFGVSAEWGPGPNAAAEEPGAEQEKLAVAAEPTPEEQEEPPPTASWVTSNFIPSRLQEPNAGTDAATLKALKRLQELGAMPAGAQADGLSIGIQSGWKGTAADLDLIAQLADLKWLYFDLDHVPAADVGKLMPKLKRPLEFLGIESLSDERLTALAKLPECKILMLGQETLSPAGFRHLAEMAPGVKSLQPRGDVDDDSLAAIGQMRSLEELQLQHARITAAGLAHFASLDHLETLLLFECRGIRGDGYANLARVKSLRRLHILGPRIDAVATQALAKLPQLETLTLQPNSFSAAGLQAADVQALRNLKNLKILGIMCQAPASDVAKQASGEALLAVAGQLPSLRELSVMGIIADANALTALAKATGLETLTLYNVTLSDRSLTALGELKNLKQLQLSSKGEVTSAAWAKLIGLKQLTTLSLEGSSLDDAGLAELADLAALEQLILPGSKITGTGLKALTNLKQLKSLNLSAGLFTNEGAEALPGLSALEWLNLTGTKITDRALDAIAKLPLMFVLNLDNTQVTADGLLKLRDLKHLSQISVSNVKLSAEDLVRVRAAMPDVQIVDQVFYNYGATNNVRAAEAEAE